MREKIIDCIFNFNEDNSPFTLRELIDRLKEKGIEDQPCIQDILDELQEEGSVSYVYRDKTTWVCISDI